MLITTSKLVVLLIPCLYLLQGLRYRRKSLALKDSPVLPDREYDDWMVKVNHTALFFANMYLVLALLTCIAVCFYIGRNFGLNDVEIAEKYDYFFRKNGHRYYVYALASYCVIWAAVNSNSNRLDRGLLGITIYLLKVYSAQDFREKEYWVNSSKLIDRYRAKHALYDIKFIPIYYYALIILQILLNGSIFMCSMQFMLFFN